MIRLHHTVVRKASAVTAAALMSGALLVACGSSDTEPLSETDTETTVPAEDSGSSSGGSSSGGSSSGGSSSGGSSSGGSSSGGSSSGGSSSGGSSTTKKMDDSTSTTKKMDDMDMDQDMDQDMDMDMDDMPESRTPGDSSSN